MLSSFWGLAVIKKSLKKGSRLSPTTSGIILNENMKKKILLIDGNSIINRGFYATPLLTNSKGEYTNGVYGFLNIFFKFLDEETPDMCVVCFDVHSPTFRHKMYEDYKGTRKGMPEELRPQMPLLKEVLASMGIKTYEKAGFEADDLLGSLAKRAEKEGYDPVIISGDRDLLQIASENISVRIPKTKGGTTTVETYFAKDVEQAYGVTPLEFIEVKALMGDTSDNVPGVPSVGEKTAVKIIQEYKSVENAIENADKVKPKKASENLREYKEQALLSKKLVTIDTKVPLDIKTEECSVKNIFNEKAYEIFKRCEFRSFLTRFSLEDNTVKNTDIKLVKDKNEAENILKNTNPFEACGYKCVYEDESLCAFSLTTSTETYVFQCDDIEEAIADFLASDSEKISQNIKEDILFWKKKGVNIKNITFDAALGAYLADSSKASYKTNDIAEIFLGTVLKSEEEVLGKGKSKKKLSDLSESELLSFVGEMSRIPFKVKDICLDRLKEENMLFLYENIELPLTYVLADMEIQGMAADRDMLKQYDASLDDKIKELEEDIYWHAGERFNINSPKQLSVILFEKLALKGGKKTKTGWSTSADVLEKLKDESDIVSEILEYRTYAKLKSTYAQGLQEVIEKDGRIHSTFNQTVTTTGRISSTEPNLQNIPVRIELGRQLRKVFIPKEGCIFLDADYSQIELRVLAAMSGDEDLTEAFKNNIDIHTMTASQVFNTPQDEVTSLQRRHAKAVNFGIIYGISAYGLSQDINVSQKTAQNYIDSYFARYPKIKSFLDNCITEAKAKGYAVTLFGRRRYIPEISSKNFALRSFGERVAMNMPIQGTAADIIKIAMVNVYKKLKEMGLKSRIILQVHDELIIETYKEEKDKVSQILQTEMENAVKLSVPLVAEVHSGNNWYDLK